jgi:hypothetical protein
MKNLSFQLETKVCKKRENKTNFALKKFLQAVFKDLSNEMFCSEKNIVGYLFCFLRKNKKNKTKILVSFLSFVKYKFRIDLTCQQEWLQYFFLF